MQRHPGGTRVTLTHGGWETLGERAESARSSYVPGWQKVLVEAFGGFCPRG